MSLDPYLPCPCGSGDKVKFCCCKDILPEMEKILRMLEGEQRMATLEHINRLLEKHPGRAALLATRAMVELRLGQHDDAQQTTEAFLEKCPDNPVALGLTAMLQTSRFGAAAAIEPLQRALQATGDTVPAVVYEAIGGVGQALLVEGDVLAARAHLMLQGTMPVEEDMRAAEMIMELSRSPQVPLLLRQGLQFDLPPDDAPWKEAFEAAMEPAERGAWLAAIENLTPLESEWPNAAAIVKAMAVLSSYLAESAVTIASLRKYASLGDAVELDDAIEAEAVAQLLDPETTGDKIEVVNVEYAVTDVELLLQQLHADDRVALMPIDPTQLGTEESPPPKGVFWLLDRAVPASGVDLALDAVPNVLGEMFVFGRQTDREARLETVLARTEDFDEKTRAIAEVAGGAVDTAAGPQIEVVNETPAIEQALTWSWHFPVDTPTDRRRELVALQRREMILRRWPRQSLAVLHGKTPREAAGEETYRIRLLAAILLLQLSGELNQWEVDYDELRTELGLPTPQPIDPEGLELTSLPAIRLPRVPADKLTDDQLVAAYGRSGVYSIRDALRAFGVEILARESLDGKTNKTHVYAVLAQVTTDSDEAIELIQKAQELNRQNNESPAVFLLSELQMRFERGEAAECQRLVDQIQARHIREPGVGQALYSMLVRFGVITPEGMPAGAPAAAPQPAAASPAAAPADDGIWTPDGTSTGGGDSGKKPTIWTPGMD